MLDNFAKLLPITLIVLIGSFFFTTPAVASCAGGVACSVVWEDDFNGTSLDTNKWEPMIGNGCSYGICNWGNNEEQYYRAENATVANGELTITAKQESFGGKNYTSARLRTLNKGDWTYGRFEMRAKFPQFQHNQARGLWPAFWMLPTSSPYGGWARSGEIDIMEIVGHQRAKIHGTIHYHDQWPNNWQSGQSYDLPNTDPDAYHVYAIEWEADEIRWYIDGLLYSSRTWWDSVGSPFPAPFDVDFHLLLNMAVGGNWPGSPDVNTVFPQEFVVDYVRVFSFDPDPFFDDMEHGDPLNNGWFEVQGAVGGGSIGANGTDVPPVNGDSFSLSSGWVTFSTPGNLGSFGRNHAYEVAANVTDFSFWINPDAGQDYTLSINLQEDDDGDGTEDEEFQYDCQVSPTGPCATAGAGWQLVTIPLSSFFDDNSVLAGGNGVLDPVSTANGGNGLLTRILVDVTLNSGTQASFNTDYWAFNADNDFDDDGIDDSLDNCTNVANAGQEDADADGHGNLCDADFNNDCAINFFDLVTLKNGFGGTSPLLDLTGDGAVNFFDLVILKNMFGASPGPSSPASLCP